MNTEPDYDKSLSRGIGDDMSGEAIARRLDIASQLWDVVNAFGRAEYLGKTEARKRAEQAPSDET